MRRNRGALITVLLTVILLSSVLNSSIYVLGQSREHGQATYFSLKNASNIYYEAKDGGLYAKDLTTGKVVKVYLFGINWFGFETEAHVVYGLQYRNWKSVLRDIKKLGFNAIRLPFCSAILHGAKPSSGMINYRLNPDLKNLTSLQIMEKIVEEANKLGIYVLLDYHRIQCHVIEPLWYTKNYSEKDYISDWIKLAKIFKNYPNVIGADIKNEPHGNASWGTGNEKTDFRLFANRVGKAILKVAPSWLIFVEGVQYTHIPQLDQVLERNKWWPFWGENLMGVKDYPLDLPKDKVVYSPHVYGPSVYDMPYFDSQDFPANLPQIWETMFGYLTKMNYTIVIGEWGGRYTGKDKIWQDAFVEWLTKKKIYNFFYWCLNPESRDTGGIFQSDWKTVNWNKMRVIYQLIKAANPGFKEPLYIIINIHPNSIVVTKGSKINVTWYTNGQIIESNFATAQNGTKSIMIKNSTTLFIVAKRDNQTVKKAITIYAIGTLNNETATTQSESYQVKNQLTTINNVTSASSYPTKMHVIHVIIAIVIIIMLLAFGVILIHKNFH